MKAKINLINGAYSQIRISGITLAASPEDVAVALNRLESMMAELQERNIGLNYNFEEIPEVNSLHNVKRAYWYSLEVMLAMRLLADFGKAIPPTLVRAETSAISFLFSATAHVIPIDPPTRMPVGSGNLSSGSSFFQFSRSPERPPADSTVHRMVLGDIDDFYLSFADYLNDGEILDDYVLEAEGGLNIISTYRTDEVVHFRIQAVDYTKEVLRMKITVNTLPDDRQDARFVTFAIDKSELSLDFQSTGVVYTVVHSGIGVLHVNAQVFHVLL